MPNSLLTRPVASRFLTRWLHADPVRIALLADTARLSPSTGQFAEFLQKQTDVGVALPAAMRRLRNLTVATLIERDLSGNADLNEVVSVMSAFADFAIRTHLSALMQQEIVLHGVPTGEESGLPQQLIVLGMGKLGGAELNVSSDIDLIFVYPEEGDCVTTLAEQRPLSNHEFFTRLGKKLIGALSEVTEDGFTFRVDMDLRPNGASGPLVANLNMLERYLIVQGRDWERYAWLKARAVTGDETDIAALEQIVRPFIYRRYLDFGSIDALRAMHRQIRAEVTRQELRHPDRSENIKLGRGGIRAIEFLAQVFQLIRGGREPQLRNRSTRATLAILAEKGLLSADAVAQLQAAYIFLRNLEHRLQYVDDAQTHTLPTAPEDRLHIAQMMGYPNVDMLLVELAQHRSHVAEQFDAIFNDPAEEQNHPDDSTALSERDTPDTVVAYLESLGFDDADAAAQRLLATWRSSRMQSLPDTSHSRLTTLINNALPRIAQLPQRRAATLARLLDFLEAIARRAAYLALLTEYPNALMRVLRMMNSSGWAAQFLTQHPILLDEILDDRNLKTEPDWWVLAATCRQQLHAAAGDTERQMDILRELHHVHIFRLLARDLEGDVSVEHLADELSSLADTLVAATLEAAWNSIATRHQAAPQFAVIAYGKLGGKELGYASDLDVIFLYQDDDPEAPALYAKLAQRFITWMTSHTSSGTLFDIDTALRPDGASGLIVSSLANFRKYQLSSAWVWEHQALTRARFCAGDESIGHAFEQLRETVLRQARDATKLRNDVLTMRKRLHDAHPNHSTLFDLKHDTGGMIDIEFIVQYLVLLHANAFPQLVADIGNIGLLRLAGELKLIEVQLAEDAASAYRIQRRLQHQIRLEGQQLARIELKQIRIEAAAVMQLWQAVFN